MEGYEVSFKVKIWASSQTTAVESAMDYVRSILNEDGNYDGELSFVVTKKKAQTYDVVIV